MAFQLAQLVADISITGSGSSLEILAGVRDAAESTYASMRQMTSITEVLPANVLATTTEALGLANQSATELLNSVIGLGDVSIGQGIPAVAIAKDQLEDVKVSVDEAFSVMQTMAAIPSLIPENTGDQVRTIVAFTDTVESLDKNVQDVAGTDLGGNFAHGAETASSAVHELTEESRGLLDNLSKASLMTSILPAATATDTRDAMASVAVSMQEVQQETAAIAATDLTATLAEPALKAAEATAVMNERVLTLEDLWSRVASSPQAVPLLGNIMDMVDYSAQAQQNLEAMADVAMSPLVGKMAEAAASVAEVATAATQAVTAPVAQIVDVAMPERVTLPTDEEAIANLQRRGYTEAEIERELIDLRQRRAELEAMAWAQQVDGSAVAVATAVEQIDAQVAVAEATVATATAVETATAAVATGAAAATVLKEEIIEATLVTPWENTRSVVESVGDALKGAANVAGVLIGAASDMAYSMKEAMNIGWPDASKSAEDVNRAVTAAQRLHTELMKIAGINWGDSLATLESGGVWAALGAAISNTVATYTERADWETMLKARFTAMRMPVEETFDKFSKALNTMRDQGSMTRSAADNMLHTALQRGMKKDDFADTAQAASAIALRIGMSNDAVMRMVNLGEENYQNYSRMLKMSGLQVRAGASQAQIMERVNLLIREGTEMQKSQIDTFGSRLTAISNALLDIRLSAAITFGKSFGEPLKGIMDTIIGVYQRINEWILANKTLLGNIGNLVQSIVLWGGSIAFAITAFTYLMSVMQSFRVISFLLAASQWVLRASIAGVGTAVRGAVAASGVGLFLVILAAAVQASGILDKLADGTLDLGSIMNSTFGGLLKMVLPVVRFLYVEFMIFYRSLVGFFEGMYEFFGKAMDSIMQAGKSAAEWLKENLGPVWDNIVVAWDAAIEYISAIWDGMLFDLEHMAGDMEIFILKMVAAVKLMPGVWEWFKMFLATFSLWFIDNFVPIMITAVKTLAGVFMSYFKMIGELYKQVWKGLTGEGFDLDAVGAKFTEGLDKLKNEAKELFKDLDLPDIADFTKGLADAELDKIRELETNREIARLENIDKKAEDRVDLGKDFDSMIDSMKRRAIDPRDVDLKGGRPLTVGFQELGSVWKKLQEQAGSGTLNDPLEVARRQLGAQEQGNKSLAALLEEARKEKKAGPPVPH